MKKMTLLAAIVLAFATCKKNKVIDDSISECMQAEIEQFKAANDAVAILTIVSQSEKVYWFKYGTFTHSIDGCDYIYNNDCEIVCNFGGKCLLVEENCPDLDSPNWETIWEK